MVISRCSAEEDVKCIGIGSVRSEDMKYWQSRNAVIKLVGYSARSGETITSCVIPVGYTIVPFFKTIDFGKKK